MSPAGTVTCLVTRLQEWSWIINHLIITLSLLRRDRHTSLSSSFIHLLQHFLFLSAGGAKHISLFLHIYCGIIPYIIILLQRPFFHNASLCVNTISPDLRFITVVASFLHFCTARTTQTLDVDSPNSTLDFVAWAYTLCKPMWSVIRLANICSSAHNVEHFPGFWRTHNRSTRKFIFVLNHTHRIRNILSAALAA